MTKLRQLTVRLFIIYKVAEVAQLLSQSNMRWSAFTAWHVLLKRSTGANDVYAIVWIQFMRIIYIYYSGARKLSWLFYKQATILNILMPFINLI